MQDEGRINSNGSEIKKTVLSIKSLENTCRNINPHRLLLLQTLVYSKLNLSSQHTIQLVYKIFYSKESMPCVSSDDGSHAS